MAVSESARGFLFMPMPCDYSKYPPNWKETRKRILERAKHKCEFCGVPNYALGYRDANGDFIPSSGNIFHEAAGRGQYPFNEVIKAAKHLNESCEGMEGFGEKAIVIVLTIAHLDHDANNHEVKDERLAALCQKCHNKYDKEYRAANRKATTKKKKGLQELKFGE